jgi:hypothetical protein
MEKEFVLYELASRMKALGFDEPCLMYFSDKSKELLSLSERDISFFQGTSNSTFTKAPLFQQAFRWFREKNFHVNIDSYHCLGKDKPFGLSIDYLHKSGKWDYVDYRDDTDFETYEEAQKRAIEVIIEIIEQNK